VSLSEVPLCLGLFFADPAALLVARLVGSSVIWLFWRRQAVIKTAFNLVNATVEIAVALLVFAAVSASAGVDNPRTWVAAALAAIVSNVVTAIAVSGVIGAAENNNPFPEMLAGVASSTPFAAFVSAYGLLAAAALSFRWWMAIPLGAAAVGSILVYWAYASLAGRHLSLERLYRFSQVVGSTPEVDEVLRTVLVEAKGLLRADRAEILFVTPASGQPGLTVRLGPNGRLMRGSAGDELHLDPVWHSVLDLSMPALLQRHTRDRIERGHLELRGLQDAIVAPLRGDVGVVGAVTIANRLGDVRTFDRDDVRLLETIANTASVAWQNSRLIDRLRHDTLHDALTGLPNRVLLQQRSAEALDAVRSAEVPQAAMLLLDLDGFKEVNDTLGHQYGDLLLREVAHRFAAAVGSRGLVARLGGDEFAVLVPHVTDADMPRALAESLLRSLEQPMVLDDLALEIGASIGVALAPEHAEHSSALLKRADVAMYAAKTASTGLQFYAPELETHAPQRLALARELRAALREHEVVIFVQPQVVLATGVVAGVEVLARWYHKDNGWIQPADFVPVAERSGLIRQLTADVLRQAIASAADWRRSGRSIGVSVNLSARNLHDLNLPAYVAELLDEYAVPADLLTLEITESSVMTYSERNVELLQRFSKMGVQLSIDDFGTGYSSLSHLRSLPVHEVKIDRSFVTNMGHSASDATIAQAIIDLGANLDLRVVAEGVEGDDTWHQLAELGCARAQGFFLSQPLPPKDFLPWLDRYERGAPRSPAEPDVSGASVTAAGW
jgi:diguanylate cyclase (GGDEF)-like protein